MGQAPPTTVGGHCMTELEPRNFLQPCLLLLLREQDDHGYGLAARLRPLHDGDGDAGRVYRALRGMERHGLVRSGWHASAVGPARRIYRITAAGVDCLDLQARELANVHAALHVFMDLYAGSVPGGKQANHDHHTAGRRNGHAAGSARHNGHLPERTARRPRH